MRLAVMADTHLYSWPSGLLKRIMPHLEQAELILHAGDIINPLLLDSLPTEVVAVCGNSDSAVTAALLPGKRVLNLAGFRIGLTHGFGAPQGLAARVRGQFEDVHAIVFGHSHTAFTGEEDKVFMFNPGSLTRPRDGAPSLGIMDLGETISGHIIRL